MGAFWGLERFAERERRVFRFCQPRTSLSKPIQTPIPKHYRALNASNHLLYEATMSSETLGFLSSNIYLKFLMDIGLG